MQVGAHAGGFGGPAGMWDAIVHDFSNITEPAAFAAFLQVLMIDIVLAGDNAIVVGALAGVAIADATDQNIVAGGALGALAGVLGLAAGFKVDFVDRFDFLTTALKICYGEFMWACA